MIHAGELHEVAGTRVGFSGITVLFFDVLPSDLFLPITYSVMNVTDSTSSTISSSMKVTRTFEGRRVSGSSNKPNGIPLIFSPEGVAK